MRDCDAPRSTVATLLTTSTSAGIAAPTTTNVLSHGHEDEHSSGIHTDDDHHSTTGSLKPSPTESVGCTVHGDHWHCDGKKADGTGTQTTATTAAASTVPTSGAGHMGGPEAMMAGAMGLAVVYNMMI